MALQLENIRREAEKDNTFSPQVIRRPQDDSDESSKVPVFERLSASRQYVHEILTQIKSEFELNECTFHPEINPLSEQLAKSYSLYLSAVYDGIQANTTCAFAIEC